MGEIITYHPVMHPRIERPDQITPDVFRQFCDWRAKQGKRNRTPAESIAHHLDRYLADAARYGWPVADPKTGQSVIGDDGKPMRRPLTASEVSAMSRRLDQLYRERVDQEQRARAAEQPQHGPPPGYEPPRRAAK